MAVLLKQFNESEIEQVFYFPKRTIKETVEILLKKYFYEKEYKIIECLMVRATYINENIIVKLHTDTLSFLTKITINNITRTIKNLKDIIEVFYLIEYYSKDNFNFNYKKQLRQKRNKKYELIEEQRKNSKWYKFFSRDNPKAKYKFQYMHSLKSLWATIKKIDGVCNDEINTEQLSPYQVNKIKRRNYKKIKMWDVYDYKNPMQIDVKRCKRQKFKTVEIK